MYRETSHQSSALFEPMGGCPLCLFPTDCDTLFFYGISEAGMANASAIRSKFWLSCRARHLARLLCSDGHNA
jgi:hypothetical protein